MKTAVEEVMDIIEMEHNNGVEISQKVLWKMLLEAKEKEKQQSIDFAYKCRIINDVDKNGNVSFIFTPELQFDKTYNNNELK